MRKRLAIGRGVKNLDQKKRGGGLNEPPCQFKGYNYIFFLEICEGVFARCSALPFS